MMSAELTYRWCSTCSGERPFEVPECLDGHAGDCPELVCTGCGTALLVGVPVGIAAGVLAEEDVEPIVVHASTAA